MLLLINSSYHLWVPTYTFNGCEYKSPVMIFLMICELLISLFCVMYTLKLCALIWKIRVFHVNMNILATAYLIQYFECFLGKWLMLSHQIGLIRVDGIPECKVFKNWWTNEQSDIPKARNAHEIFPFLLGGFFLWHYMYSMTGVIFSFCAERTMATVLSKDYEKHRRTYISFVILVASHCVTLTMSYRSFFEITNFMSSVIGCMACVTASCLIFVIIMFANLKINSIQSRTTHVYVYTLAFRFQVEENIRSLKLVYRILICFGVYIFLLCIMLFFLFFDLLPVDNTIFTLLLENCIHLNPIVICSVVVFSIDPWKKAILHDYPILRLRIFSLCFNSTLPASNTKSCRGDHRESDVYFKQLQTSWHGKQII